MKILAIDPGTEGFGWAVGSPGQPPFHATYRPIRSHEDLGSFLVDIRTMLWPRLTTSKVDLIVYESPAVVRTNNIMTMRKMFALGGFLEVLGHDHNVEVVEAHPASVRKHFLGRGNTPKASNDIKKAVIARCNQLGWEPETDHEADALAILDYALAIKGSRLAQMGLI